MSLELISKDIYTISYIENDWVFKVSLKDVEKQVDVGEGETVTDSYQMLNTRLTKTYILDGSELKISVFGSNLLDEVARNHSSFVRIKYLLQEEIMERNLVISFNPFLRPSHS